MTGCYRIIKHDCVQNESPFLHTPWFLCCCWCGHDDNDNNHQAKRVNQLRRRVH